MLALSIVIMLLNHLYTRSGSICYIRYRKTAIKGHCNGCVAENIGIQIKVQAEFLSNGLQPLIQKLTELFVRIVFSIVGLFLLIVHDRENISVFRLPFVFVDNLSHDRGYRNLNRTVRFLAPDGDCVLSGNIPPLGFDHVTGRKERVEHEHAEIIVQFHLLAVPEPGSDVRRIEVEEHLQFFRG